MRKSKLTEEQVALALRQAEAGTPVVEIFRKLGITGATFCRWKKKFRGARRARAPGAEAAPTRGPEAEVAGGRPEHGQGDPPGGAKKRVASPALLREVVALAQRADRLSGRWATQTVGAARSTIRDKSGKFPQEPLPRRIRELVQCS